MIQMRWRVLRSAVSAALCALLVVLSPGLECYAAGHAVFRGRVRASVSLNVAHAGLAPGQFAFRTVPAALALPSAVLSGSLRIVPVAGDSRPSAAARLAPAPAAGPQEEISRGVSVRRLPVAGPDDREDVSAASPGVARSMVDAMNRLARAASLSGDPELSDEQVRSAGDWDGALHDAGNGVFSGQAMSRDRQAAALSPSARQSPAGDILRPGGLSEPETALVRDVLGFGTLQPDGRRIASFVFKVSGRDIAFKARGAGLEGFLYSKKEIEGDFGPDSLLPHIDDYFNYLEYLLAPAASVAAVADLRVQLRKLRALQLGAAEKDARLVELLNRAVIGLGKDLAAVQPSSWMRTARVYEIFPRAYNLPGRRAWLGMPARTPGKKFFADFTVEDLIELKKDFDAVWVMGIFPIGERNRLGTAGGSPYSIKDHAALNAELGSKEEFKAFVRRAQSVGLKVVIDFVPNHTSTDSRLLEEHPDFFIHREVEGDPQKPPEGYFPYFSKLWNRWIWVAHGGFDMGYWPDTAQLDYSQQGLRDYLAQTVGDWVSETKVDAFRVDMAYLVTNAYFSRIWKRAMPPGEFLDQLMRHVRGRDPATAFAAEIYDLRDFVSGLGFDALYNKNDMDKSSGQYGWYDAWLNSSIYGIRAAIRNVAYLMSQTVGAVGMQFIGNHDESGPQRQERGPDGAPISGLGRLWKAAALLTGLLPGCLLFYGSQEIGFDAPDPLDFPKPISFKSPASVDWESWASAHPDMAAFFKGVFAAAREIRQALGAVPIEPLEPKDGEPWVGYILRPAAGSSDQEHFYAVVGNPSERAARVRIQRPDLGLDYELSLDAGDARALRFSLPFAGQPAEAVQAGPAASNVLAGPSARSP